MLVAVDIEVPLRAALDAVARQLVEPVDGALAVMLVDDRVAFGAVHLQRHGSPVCTGQ